MEEKFAELLNKIKYLIQEDKITEFNKTVKKFEKDNEIKLKLLYENEVVKIKYPRKKVPEDLEKRLFEFSQVEEVKFTISEESSDDEIITICVKIFTYLDDIEKRNKGYYYNLGYLLSVLKTRSINEKDFLTFAKETFGRSKSIINDYIRFYNACNSYSVLISCNLSYREIMKNLPEIKEILDRQRKPIN